MSSLPSTPPDTQQLSDLISSVPPPMRRMVQTGLALFSSMPAQQREVVQAVIDNYASKEEWSIDQDALADELGIGVHDAGALISFSSFLVAVASMSDDTPQQLADQLQQIGVVDSTNSAVVSALIERLIPKRVKLKAAIERNTLASAVMPSFTSLSASVDVRLKFKDSSVLLAVPVVVARIETDISSEAIVFQLSSADVNRLVEQFQKIQGQIATAEQWIPNTR